jgi:hypothetical protein
MLQPKPGGALALTIGVVLLVISIQMAHTEGKIKLLASLIGPACVILGIAMLVVPTSKLFRVIGEDNNHKPIYDVQPSGYQPLYIGLLAVAILTGIVFTALIYFGVV